MYRPLSAYLFILVASLVISSCGGDNESMEDYREKWVGSYEGTKSNTSLDDTVMTTPISFDVMIDEDSSDGLIINGITFPISEQGIYGPEFLDDGIYNYTVTIDGERLTLESYGSIPNGIILPCFIKVTKI